MKWRLSRLKAYAEAERIPVSPLSISTHTTGHTALDPRSPELEDSSSQFFSLGVKVSPERGSDLLKGTCEVPPLLALSLASGFLGQTAVPSRRRTPVCLKMLPCVSRPVLVAW